MHQIDRQALPSQTVSAAKDSRLGWPQDERRKIRAAPSSGYPVSRTSITPGSGDSFTPSIQSPGDNSVCVYPPEYPPIHFCHIHKWAIHLRP